MKKNKENKILLRCLYLPIFLIVNFALTYADGCVELFTNKEGNLGAKNFHWFIDPFIV